MLSRQDSLALKGARIPTAAGRASALLANLSHAFAEWCAPARTPSERTGVRPNLNASRLQKCLPAFLQIGASIRWISRSLALGIAARFRKGSSVAESPANPPAVSSLSPQTRVLLLSVLLLPSFKTHAATALMEFDLTQPAAASAWQWNAHDSRFRVVPEGLEVTITGGDPYFYGPLLSVATNQPLRLVVRLRSETGGGGQVFAFSQATGHDLLADFDVARERWQEVRLDLPALSPAHRLRLDPPGETGKCIIASIRLEPRQELPPPKWPAWSKPAPAPGMGVSNAFLQILSHPRNAQSFELRVGGKSTAFGNLVPRIAYMRGDELGWTEVRGGRVRTDSDRLSAASRWTDADGAEWNFTTGLRPVGDRVEVDVEVWANRDRDVLYLPLLELFAGEGSFGAQKRQGLLAGLEYLDNEPSSSELDIVGPGAQRQVPASYQLTFPLMAVEAEGRYVALAWDDTQKWSALFDSPDRIFGSGGHVMAVIWPGTDKSNRTPGSLLVKNPRRLEANKPLRLRAWLLVGSGDSVVPAIQHYVKLAGLPPLPDAGYTLAEYANLMAHGWLASKIRVGDRYRHAWAGDNFPPAPAADAAVFESWLAPLVANAGLEQELRSSITPTLDAVGYNGLYESGVGHIHTPIAPLVFGHVNDAIAAARDATLAGLASFDDEGRVLYHRAEGRPDFGKGYSAPDANGLTATVLTRALEGAAFCGDPKLIARTIELLRKLDKFHGTVPRGAQTWEIPLHTPDILASAYLVRAYVDGYELTGDRHFLDEAIYWAWTGVPFVYLVNPTGEPVGPYATIAVLGATHWKAPNWMGLPVQWCGMVYADALYRLMAHDPAGPWRRLADGITTSGIQQTYPLADSDRGGLLPDSFVLMAQHRNPPDINPATVGVSAVRLYTQSPLYEFRALPESRLLVHAPGQIKIDQQSAQTARFHVRGWPRDPYFVLINGLKRRPGVQVNGQPRAFALPDEFLEAGGQLILQLRGDAEVGLTL